LRLPLRQPHPFPTRRSSDLTIDTAVCSGIAPDAAEAGVGRFGQVLMDVMAEGHEELARDQPAYPGVADTIEALHRSGLVQTVLRSEEHTSKLQSLRHLVCRL